MRQNLAPESMIKGRFTAIKKIGKVRGAVKKLNVKKSYVLTPPDTSPETQTKT